MKISGLPSSVSSLGLLSIYCIAGSELGTGGYPEKTQPTFQGAPNLVRGGGHSGPFGPSMIGIEGSTGGHRRKEVGESGKSSWRRRPLS